ncbi:MAG TPA: hypothetical protein VKQ72_06925, partial [Aggregatilineales bacterium]|nr:hypothetical protein [Aggregatilineales bacterium]
LGLAGGLLFALSASERSELSRREQAIAVLRSWPWIQSLLVGAVVIVIVGTVFLIYPRGLSAIGEMAAQALQGLVHPAPGYGFAYPLATSLLYEPILWIFGLAGAYLVLRREEEFKSEPVHFWQLGMVGWLAISILAALLYRGGQSQHALWFTLPLVGLSAVAIERILTPVRDQFWNPPAWGAWVYGLAVIGMIAIAGVNLVAAGQTFAKTAPDQTPNLDVLASLRTIVEPAVIIVILVMTGVMIAGMWGRRTAWRGIGIGLLTMFSLFSLSAGWRAAVPNADNPREFWRPLPAARNLNLLEITLKTASQRVTGTLIDVPILIQSDPSGPIDDGALAWTLRRFHNLQYVTEIPPTTNGPVLILPESAGKPATTASYVGQAFPVYFTWDRNSLSWDILLWLYNRESRVQPTPFQRVIVWVRSDVYGVPPQSSTSPGVQPAPNQSGQSNNAGPGSAP